MIRLPWSAFHILTSICALSTLLWTRVLLWQPLWLVRATLGDSLWEQDLVLFLVIHALYTLWGSPSGRFFALDDIQSLVAFNSIRSFGVETDTDAPRIYLQTFALLGLCGGFAGFIVLCEGPSERHGGSQESHERHRIDEALLPPLLITSRTTHSRQVPKKHAFSYSYLFVGVPVGLEGRVGNALSVDSERPAWFAIHSPDFLARGTSQLGLQGRLESYLYAQGVAERDWTFAYLVTAPRFFAYSFNPVSFWYLYDSDGCLNMMVLEVNNTFGERRMYLLRSEQAEVGAGESPHRTPTFTNSWAKDFHVSPFNSRKGSYSLRAVDPLAAFQETGHVKIDNTIVLRSSQGEPKIVARVYSEGKPHDPSRLTTMQLMKFIATWWWVGLATFPRIVWEAQKLFFQRKLHVWYRPEVTGTSVGREYSEDERVLEFFFRAFLTHTVESAREPLRVIYEPAHSQADEVVLSSPGFAYEEGRSRALTMKILSPAFYSRFVHYAHAREAFDREFSTTDDRNKTLTMEGAHTLPLLLDSLSSSSQTTGSTERNAGLLDDLRWHVLRRLRCPPAAGSYPNQLRGEPVVPDRRPFPCSEMDRYVRQYHHGSASALYRRTVTKLFVAERAAFGLPELVSLLDRLFRMTFILTALRSCATADVRDVLRPRPLHLAGFLHPAFALLLANSLHLWSFLKGSVRRVPC